MLEVHQNVMDNGYGFPKFRVSRAKIRLPCGSPGWFSTCHTANITLKWFSHYALFEKHYCHSWKDEGRRGVLSLCLGKSIRDKTHLVPRDFYIAVFSGWQKQFSGCVSV